VDGSAYGSIDARELAPQVAAAEVGKGAAGEAGGARGFGGVDVSTEKSEKKGAVFLGKQVHDAYCFPYNGIKTC
jgi:hypothetical protein